MIVKPIHEHSIAIDEQVASVKHGVLPGGLGLRLAPLPPHNERTHWS